MLLMRECHPGEWSDCRLDVSTTNELIGLALFEGMLKTRNHVWSSQRSMRSGLLKRDFRVGNVDRWWDAKSKKGKRWLRDESDAPSAMSYNANYGKLSSERCAARTSSRRTKFKFVTSSSSYYNHTKINECLESIRSSADFTLKSRGTILKCEPSMEEECSLPDAFAPQSKLQPDNSWMHNNIILFLSTDCFFGAESSNKKSLTDMFPCSTILTCSKTKLQINIVQKNMDQHG